MGNGNGISLSFFVAGQNRSHAVLSGAAEGVPKPLARDGRRNPTLDSETEIHHKLVFQPCSPKRSRAGVGALWDNSFPGKRGAFTGQDKLTLLTYCKLEN